MQPDFYARFLTEPHVGVLATLRSNGLPYTVPVWWLWHQDAQVSGHVLVHQSISDVGS